MEYWQGISLRDPVWDFDRDVLPILSAVKLEPFSESIKRIIVERWGEPWRFYHGTGHFIDGLHKLWALIRHLPLEEQQMIILAWIFHDAVYLPGATLNEWASAKLAEAWLTGRGFADKFAHTAYNLILESKYHYPTPGKAPSARLSRLLFDVDLSRFAGPPELVAEDRELLFLELGGDMYKSDFFAANLEFLSKLLERRTPLYQTRACRKYNPAARANLELIFAGEL